MPAGYAAIGCCAAAQTSKLALRFLVLTAARPGEVCAAQWAEIDLPDAVWTIPAARMKAGVEHRVPLSVEALRVLSEAKADSTGVYVFGAGGKPLGAATMLKVLRREGIDSTAHGFRSTFRQWCADTGKPADVAEMALGHAVKGIEGVYQRSDIFDRRRSLMQAWSDYLARKAADVVQLPA